MVDFKSKYSGVFKSADGIKMGETYEKYTILGIIATGWADYPMVEILCPAKGKLVYLCEDWTKLKRGEDIIVQIKIIPE